MKHLLKIFFLVFLSSCILPSKNTGAQNNSNRLTWWAQKVDSTGLHNLYKLNDTIYRSEQPDSIEFSNLKKLGIKSILNTRTEQNDIKSSGNQEFNYYSVPMNAERFTNAEIIKTLQIIRDAPKPILIHCLHGSDRTGVVIAMYRIIYENRSKKEALTELKKGNYNFNRIFINIPKYIKKADIELIKSGLNKN